MADKSKAYHLDIQTHGKNPYGLLRNSYREDGKVKKETLCRFTGLSLEQLRMMQASIQGKAILKEDFKIINSREYGASFTCVSLIKKLGLHKNIFSRPHEQWVRSCMAMITGRLVYAGSKLSLSHCGSYSALWEICGITGEVDVNSNCYDTMDKLLERQEAIQAMGKVVNKYKMGKFIVFSGSGDELSYTIDQEKVEQESALDGCYVVFTDASKEEMTASETVKNYKSLIKVEQAFRNLKTVQLEMRPVYHKRDDRIKCHVFICMLAYYNEPKISHAL